MRVRPTNLVFIMSDEHNKRVLGCDGHPQIKTPNLDLLAAAGTRFSAAYTNCPICVPSRASFATGQHVHKIRYWDNAMPYDGRMASWGHRLMAQGHRVASVGKLHYSADADSRLHGFDEEILPLHLHGEGDLLGLIREELPRRDNSAKLGPEAGRGESDYTQYDLQVAAEAVKWLRQRALTPQDRPWMLFVGFVSPHFPLIAPPQFYDMYPEDAVPWPDMYEMGQRPQHPFTDAMRKSMYFDEPFDKAMVRRAISAYFGLTSFMDDNVGQILRTLNESGLINDTRVIYTSDHGDNLGTRGMWGKSTMYEESAGIPMIMTGPDIPVGQVCDTPVSLVDAFPTILQAIGAQAHPQDTTLPGTSLIDIARGKKPKRTVLSEYHAAASVCGSYMIRHGNWKYVHYATLPPMLFDLSQDPYERHDLGRDPRYHAVIAECETVLRQVVDPEAVDRLAKQDQQVLIAKHGGTDAILGRRATHYYSPPPDTPSAN